jgi:hypothetical protein
MELKEILQEAVKERFKANSIIDAVVKNIENQSEYKIFEKYKDCKLYNDGLEFELVGVHSYIYISESLSVINRVYVELAFFCVSKLPKEKKDKVDEARLEYKKSKYLMSCKFKIPLWKELKYQIDLEKIFSGDINLEIK